MREKKKETKAKKPAVKKDAEKLTDVTAPRPLIVYTDKKYRVKGYNTLINLLL